MPSGNTQQTKAIEHGPGPLLVLAGPGSGKTFVITNRVKYLIEKHHISPDHILVITFTRAAAMEMKERFLSLSGGQYNTVSFGTFHAIFYSIIKEQNKTVEHSILKDYEKKSILKLIFKEESLQELSSPEFADGILQEFSELKRKELSSKNYPSLYLSKEQFSKIYHRYTKTIKEHHKLDFDDMIIECKKLLQKSPAVLEKWKEKFQYILIDEVQDISPLQYDIVKMLGGKEGKGLTLVGDDDQSIYGFRGASPKIMQDFLKDYTNSEQILLSVNYRCSGHVLDAALQVINQNTQRFRKELQANKEPGEPVRVLQFETQNEQHEYLIREIKELIRIKSPSEIAILVRKNKDGDYLAASLLQRKIPVVRKEKSVNPYTTSECLDILAYLKLSIGEGKRQHFLRVMNKPLRYLKREALQKEEVSKRELLSYYGDSLVMQNRIRELFENLQRVSALRPFLAINYIRKGIGYENVVLGNLIDTAREKILEKIDAMQMEAKNYQSIAQFILAWEEKAELFDSQILNKTTKGDGVQIMTYHGSKGLEFEYVFLPYLTEGVVPAGKHLSLEILEEERRMFYVAMTRAKTRLTMTYDTEASKKRSDFLN